MRRKIAIILTVVLVSSLGAASCGGLQQQAEDRAREEVKKGQKQVEERMRDGQKQVEEKMQDGRKQVEKKAQ